MSFFASLAIALPLTTAAFGPAAHVAAAPHPAVVRVMAPESDGVAFGSGTLVSTRGEQGLVVTNWHVVRDAEGQIVVIFPDGFRSAARVLATDPDWDLAALAIWRPGVEPIRVADDAPRPGDTLSIAGYGSGRYRSTSGRCTQYVAPGPTFPFEMVELSGVARQGDSGGPILNQRGELAGVLFGSGQGTTTGSYCGRVRWFLSQVTDEFRGAPNTPGMLAADRLPDPPAAVATRPSPPMDDDPWEPPAVASVAPPSEPPAVTAAIAAGPPSGEGQDAEDPAAASTEGWTASHAEAEYLDAPPEDPTPAPAGLPTRFDQIKTFLAAIGALAVLFHTLRLLSIVQGS